MTVGRLLEEMSGRELSEWQAYLTRDAQVTALVAKGTDSALAYDMVWGAGRDADTAAEDDAE
jgi:hypothetical protein